MNIARFLAKHSESRASGEKGSAMSAEHRVSPANQAMVIALSCNGQNQTRIAEHLGVDEKTLRKWYGQELSSGKENVGAQAVVNLVRLMKGDSLRLPYNARASLV
jgi:hypothetical protein